jgi:hypothetical protein
VVGCNRHTGSDIGFDPDTGDVVYLRCDTWG